MSTHFINPKYANVDLINKALHENIWDAINHIIGCYVDKKDRDLEGDIYLDYEFMHKINTKTGEWVSVETRTRGSDLISLYAKFNCEDYESSAIQLAQWLTEVEEYTGFNDSQVKL